MILEIVSSAEARARLAAVAQGLEEARAWKRELTRVHTRLTHHVEAHGHPQDRDSWDRLDALREAITQVNNGVRRGEGVSLLIPNKIAGRPGLAEIDHRIAALVAEDKALRKYLVRWPDNATTHPYTFVGASHAYVGGRRLEPGDIVQLNQSQAKGWADRFKPVPAKGTQAATENASQRVNA